MSARFACAIVTTLCLLPTAAAAAPFQAAAPASTPAAAKSDEDKPLKVFHLKSNSLVVGRIVSETTDTYVIDAGDLGKLTIQKSDVVAQLDPAVVAAALQGPGAPPAGAAGASNFEQGNKVTWSRSLAFTGNYTSAPYIQQNLDPSIPALTGKALKLPGTIYQVQTQLQIQRSDARGVASLEASTTYAYADNIGEQANNPKVTAGYNFKVSKDGHVYGVLRHTYNRDTVQKIEFANQTILGVGFKAVNTAKVKWDVVPGFSMQYDRKGTPFDDQLLAGVAAYEVLEIKVGAYAQLEHHMNVYRAANHGDYYGFELYGGFRGMVAKHIGLSVGFTQTLDNALSLRATPIPASAIYPGSPAFNVFANHRTTSAVTTGLIIKF